MGRPPPNSTKYLVTPDRRYIEVELTIGSTRWREIGQDECRRRTKHYLDHGGDANRWRKVFGLENSTGLAGDDDTLTEPATASATVKKPKRSTERGDGRAKLIPALTKHHEYADGGCLNWEPVGNNELARLADVAPSTASAFFKKEFESHTKYKQFCHREANLIAKLMSLNGETIPPELFNPLPDEHADAEPDDDGDE
jgi:hypothetical protein